MGTKGSPPFRVGHHSLQKNPLLAPVVADDILKLREYGKYEIQVCDIGEYEFQFAECDAVLVVRHGVEDGPYEFLIERRPFIAAALDRLAQMHYAIGDLDHIALDEILDIEDVLAFAAILKERRPYEFLEPVQIQLPVLLILTLKA